MANSLSNLVDNLTEGIREIKCNDCDCSLKYKSVKNNLIKFKCLSCNEDYSNKLDEKLKKRFKNTFKFSDNDINKFILLLKKGVYPYEYTDDWKKFETTLPEEEELYSNLNMEDITDADYIHLKRVFKDFEIKNLVNIMICVVKVIHYFWLMFLETSEKCVWKFIIYIL